MKLSKQMQNQKTSANYFDQTKANCTNITDSNQGIIESLLEKYKPKGILFTSDRINGCEDQKKLA